MLRYCCFLFALFLFLCKQNDLHGEMYDEEDDLLEGKNPIFVSLGCDCMPARCLRKEGLRYAAFPFDWNHSLILDKVIQLLDEDFRAFLSIEHLNFYEPHQVICNHYYMIGFRHDKIFFNSKYKTFSLGVYEKYQRRIERFRGLREFEGKVFFIRSSHDSYRWPFKDYGDDGIVKINREEALALKNALERYFPDLDFTLVIINYDWSGVSPITDIDKVIEYKISSFHKTKKYSSILKELLWIFDLNKLTKP